MMPLTPLKQTLISLLAMTCLGLPQAALAQSITAAPDGTGTVIKHNGNTYSITGGTQAGGNLFHSFQELGLAPNEIADFLSNPNIQNVLGRVVGGNPSVIEGLIRLSGGNSNLYLMNPAGMVFSNGASLDVPGSFAATTATRIGFNNGFFNAYGENDYAALTGDPMSFIFDRETGTIFNEAMLEVPEGESLWLVGSSVLSTGTIEVENGNVTIAAIPEGNQIKISHDGMILDLVLAAAPLGGEGLPEQIGLKPTDIPRYLTGGNQQNADTVVVAADGTVYLTQDGDMTPFATGDVGIAGVVAAENVQLMAAGNVTATDVELVEGDTTVVRFPGAGDPLALTVVDATVDDYKRFLFGGKSGSIAFTVDADENGISAITNQLSDIVATQKVDEVHIVSEGSAGNFWLGNAFVSGATLGQYQDQLQTWNGYLTETADLLLYSCLTALGSVGDQFLGDLARATGADMAASTNLTGSAVLGADWTLEASTGTIEAALGFEQEVLADYDSKLAIFTVTDGGDSGVGTLREAIGFANGAAGADEIRFNGVTLVDLTSGELGISDELTITGGTTNVTMERNATAPDFRIFNVTGGVTTTFDHLTIRNGKTTGDGGGINSNGKINLTNSTVSGNSSGGFGGGSFSQFETTTVINSTVSGNSSGSAGAGIAAYGQVTVTDSTVSGNSASGGGGIHAGGDTIVTNSTVSGNSSDLYGGGILAYGMVTVTNSTVSGNSSGFYGGGIFGADTTVTNSTVSGNSSLYKGGGIFGGDTTVTNSTITGNSSGRNGGGIFSGYRTTTVINSTVSGNSSGSTGGGIGSYALVTVTDSTVSGNSTSGSGGGIYTRLDTTVTNSTVSGNSSGRDGGGIQTVTVNLTNSMVLSNSGSRRGGGISATTTNLTGSTVSGNSSGDRGGGIHANTVELDNSVVSNNMSRYEGGGIFANTVNIASDSEVSGNNARYYGGGIYAGTVNVTGNSKISGNRGAVGGGISATTVNVTDSEVSGNTSSGGGGIFAQGTVTLRNAQVTDNSSNGSGGGIFTNNNINVTDSTVSDNSSRGHGGGIYANNVNLMNSTVSGNSAVQSGGGIMAFSTTTVNNSTVSGNSAGRSGGGIFTSGATLNNSTIVNNTVVNSTATTNGGGLAKRSGSGGVDIANTIIANNVATTGNDLSGAIASIQNSLIGDATGATIGTNLNNLIGVDPMLLPLANNGGPTQTHALQVGSPAIDSGNNTFVTPATDQRGEARIQFGTVDIGAVESAIAPPTAVVSPLATSSTSEPTEPTLDTAEIQRSALDTLEETEELIDGVMGANACRTVPKVTIEQEQDISLNEELETEERLELDADCDPVAIDTTEAVTVSGR
ncbi:MAG: DUF4347 domain-containing protein [Spirulina sp. SIO3F2]|nr:DUF4347 domain-containing protein [Spirulina sp. SIO3F2]